MKRVARFEIEDRCKNVDYLTVSVDEHKAVHYSLVSSKGVPLALANICANVGIFPPFDGGNLLEDVRVALNKCYTTTKACQVNPALMDEAEKKHERD